jgi:hypothetical protein
MNSFWPVISGTFCVETTLPVTFAMNIVRSLG